MSRKRKKRKKSYPISLSVMKDALNKALRSRAHQSEDCPQIVINQRLISLLERKSPYESARWSGLPPIEECTSFGDTNGNHLNIEVDIGN